MPVLAARNWVPAACEAYIQSIATDVAAADAAAIEQRIVDLVDENLAIHDDACINLNPATNVMNPKAEAMLARGLSSRPSLGYPGDKYEMGLEAIEKIEVIAAELAAEVFQAKGIGRHLALHHSSGDWHVTAAVDRCARVALLRWPDSEKTQKLRQPHHRIEAALPGLESRVAASETSRHMAQTHWRPPCDNPRRPHARNFLPQRQT